MIINTDTWTKWAKKHLVISVPIATTVLAWYAAKMWQSAITHNETALMVFYFFVCATSGVSSAVLILVHLARLGLFE